MFAAIAHVEIYFSYCFLLSLTKIYYIRQNSFKKKKSRKADRCSLKHLEGNSQE